MKLLAVVLSSCVLIACGGGSSTPTSSNLTVTGTAATGLAIAGATVTAKCKVGTGTATTLANGTFMLAVTDGQLPCVLQVTNPVDGTKLHTLAFGTGDTAVANITPLTEMTTARVLGSEPNVFFAAFDANVATQKVTTANVATAQTAIDLVFAGIVDTTPIGDFITTPLVAATQGSPTSGDAHDRLLDALKLEFTTAQLGMVTTALASEQTTDAIVASMTGSGTSTPVAPVANAGVEQSVVAGATVTLDASTSSAAAGKTLTYAWSLTAKPAGSAAILAAATTAKPTFLADVAGSYVASVIVNDGTKASSASAVTVSASVANAAPVANAGVAQSVVTNRVVTLDGSTSSDANGDSLTYAWTLTSKPTGSTAALSSATSSKPTFTADVAGTYLASLTVNDGKISSTTVTVSITAAVANAAPVANAGPAQTIVAGSTVALDGSGSTDANGDALTASWSITSKPAGSVASLSNPSAAKTTFVAYMAGVYIASLVVNDGKVSSAPSTVAVTTGLAALAIGSGTLAQEFPFGKFYDLNESTGALTAKPDACQGFNAADTRPDGRVVAVSINSSVVSEIDIISGACQQLFVVPEPMIAIAVASDGTIVTISQATTFGVRQVYRFNATGNQQSKIALGNDDAVYLLSGSSAFLAAIDFDKNDVLYATTSNGSIWMLDPVSGFSKLKANLIAGTGDIDIDGSGTLRTISFGTLKFISTTTWQATGSRVLERDIFGFSPLVHR